jgi:hypothetical protein
VDINKWSVDGITPIMVAAIEGHDLAAEQLLIKGARLDICDKDDRSVVFHAAKENQGQVLKRLLGSAEGRDLIEVTDQFDNLPIHVAAKGRAHHMFSRILKLRIYDFFNEIFFILFL